jgi:diaminopimelate decarboxylase
VVAGNAGILVTTVLDVKPAENRRFVIVDAAMNDLVRPAMYDAWHAIEPVRAAPADAPLEPADLVGPVCETGDTFAIDRPLPPLAPGDLLVIRTAGAYGAVMASTYNSRLLVPEVMVKGDRFAVIRPRTDYDGLIASDRLPDWLRPPEDTMLDRGAA